MPTRHHASECGGTCPVHRTRDPQPVSIVERPHRNEASGSAMLGSCEDAKSFVAVLDSRGNMISQDSSPDEAYLRARRASPTGTVIVDAAVFAGCEPEENPLPKVKRASAADGFAQQALVASRIERVGIDWSAFRPLDNPADMKLALDARAALRARCKELYTKLAEETKDLVHAQGGVGQYAKKFDPAWLANEFLRQNQKMKKVLEGESSYDSIGLSLLPHGASWRAPFDTSTEQGGGGATNCLFSTKQCRMVCLVNTGLRAVGSGAFVSSFLFSKLLREMPEQFCISLFERCCAAFEEARGEGFNRLIRLNVISDLPWELLAPGMLEGIAGHVRKRALGRRKWRARDGLAFYDYTKIPYRRGVDDVYDLTLSFSGSSNMFGALFDVIEGKRTSPNRAAVVFVKREQDVQKDTGVKYRGDAGGPLHTEDSYFPWKFLDQRVWNGDKNDIRPLDPESVKIVGLAYKPARYKVDATPGALNAKGEPKKFELLNMVEPRDLDSKMPSFLVRVVQPDPDAPPIVCAIQDVNNRKLKLTVFK